jgi:acetyl esterase/lipase
MPLIRLSPTKLDVRSVLATGRYSTRLSLSGLALIAALTCQGCHRHHHHHEQGTANGAVVAMQTQPSEARTIKDLCYVPGKENRSQSLDLYLPASSGQPLPLIVYIHGGGWAAGDKAQGPNDPLEKSGYACASLNYRLSDEATFPAQIYDCKAAIRWLRAHAKEYNINPNKIGVWGISAGGLLASLLGTSGGAREIEGNEGNLETNSAVQAVCDWCGPADLTKFSQEVGPHQRLDPDDPDGVIAKFLGGLPKEKQANAQLANPIKYISADDPPFLIMHGDVDDIVPIAQSKDLYAALQSAHVESKMVTASGAGHDFFTPDAAQEVINFFDQHLK